MPTHAVLLLLLAAAPAPPGDADRALARDVFRELVEMDTSQSTGETTRAAKAVAARLRRAGLPAADVQVLGPSGKKQNLVARLHGSGKQRPLLLLAHLDVVDAHRPDWSFDPYAFLERDGYFYGRGTQDDKSLAALWVATVLRLHRERRALDARRAKAAPPPQPIAGGAEPSQGSALDRDVILALTADEENGPENGVAWLLAHHRELIDAALCLTEGAVGEIKDGRLVSLDVQPAEKGYLSFALETKHKGGHSSLPEPDNAIVRLGDALAKIQRASFPLELNPVTRAYFEKMSAVEHGALAADMQAVAGARPDDAAARLSRLPFYNARLRTTCTPTQISGGHAENALPQRARAIVNCRVLPGHDAREIQRALAGFVADPAVEISVVKPMDPSPLSPVAPELLDTLARAGAALWPGVPVVPVMAAGATDGRFLRAAGIPTYGLTGLFIDIMDNRAHGKDERLPVKSFFDAQDFLYRVVVALTAD